MTTAMIVARAASKMWNDTAGLRPIDLDVDAGQLVVVRGRSGSGKSTLLALLAGWCRPDTGTITIDGVPPSSTLPWETLAFVPQVLALARELSVAENVAEGAWRSAADCVTDALALVDLVAEARRPIERVSMGQQQRCSVARALVARPHVLLADEPTSYQDGVHAAAVVGALRHAATGGSAVLVASHDPSVIDSADRVIDL